MSAAAAPPPAPLGPVIGRLRVGTGWSTVGRTLACSVGVPLQVRLLLGAALADVPWGQKLLLLAFATLPSLWLVLAGGSVAYQVHREPNGGRVLMEFVLGPWRITRDEFAFSPSALPWVAVPTLHRVLGRRWKVRRGRERLRGEFGPYEARLLCQWLDEACEEVRGEPREEPEADADPRDPSMPAAGHAARGDERDAERRQGEHHRR